VEVVVLFYYQSCRLGFFTALRQLFLIRSDAVRRPLRDICVGSLRAKTPSATPSPFIALDIFSKTVCFTEGNRPM